MKRTTIIVSALLCALAIAGCGPDKVVGAEALAGVMYPVLNRHDAYIEADQTLTGVEQDTALRSSALCRELVETALAE